MRDTLIVFGVLLLVLMLLSSFGGSIRPKESFSSLETSALPMVQLPPATKKASFFDELKQTLNVPGPSVEDGVSDAPAPVAIQRQNSDPSAMQLPAISSNVIMAPEPAGVAAPPDSTSEPSSNIMQPPPVISENFVPEPFTEEDIYMNEDFAPY